MKRLWLLVGLLLAACAPQAHAGLKPSASAPTPTGDLIYVQDPQGPRMLELDWSGRLVGSVSAQGFSGPSPDGSKFLRAGDHVSVEDSAGRPLGQLGLDPNVYGLAIWADDRQHVCGIVLPPNSSGDGGEGSLWIGAAGEAGRAVGPVGMGGFSPGVAACSVRNNRAIVVGGLFPHWPPGATRYLITAQVEAINLSTGAIEYQRRYPLGYLANEDVPGAAPAWILVAASADARYVAESGVFNGTTTIREMPAGKEVGHLHGSIRGFSWDGSRVVAGIFNAGVYAAEVIDWADNQVIWHRDALAQSMLAKPQSPDVMVGLSPPAGGAAELVVVNAAGDAKTIARDAMVSWPCPCPAGP